jgi:hypothetical protein
LHPVTSQSGRQFAPDWRAICFETSASSSAMLPSIDPFRS